MAITRGLMQRELYAGGGILSLTPRSKFGLGSKLKRFVRKVIPNEVADIAVKAAPFVAPFNPLLAGAMSGIGTFDKTGSISQSVKSGLINYGMGQAGRYIGGAGFQEGINPFAGFDASASFGGLGSLFSSPIGTQTGLKLGQYQMFGGTPTQKVVDPSAVPTDSIFVQPGEAGTYTYTDMPGSGGLDDIIRLEAGSITPSGQIVSGTAAQNQAVLDQLAKQTITDTTSNVVQKATERGYMDIFKDVVSGDMNKSTSALKELGGKALKDIYTKPVPGSPGQTQIDKLAVGATIAGGASYLEAKKLAKEAELVDQEDQYTEEMYNADRQRWTDYYSQIITPANFGVTSKANGGRVGYAFGSEEPVMEDKGLGIPSITLTKEEDNTKVASLNKNRISQLLGLLESPNLDEDYREQIQQEIDQLMGKFATGGRVQYGDGSDDPYDRIEKKIIQIDPLKQDLDDQLGIGAALAPGLIKLMSRGAPKFTSAEKTLVIRNLAGRSKGKADYKELGVSIPEAKKIMDNPAANLKDATILKEFVKMLMGKKDGGRIGYMMGSEVPVRQNQAGVNEMDYRNTGGFVPPIGVKEKADDIPAMLSNNEFVFTADAVRAAGGGSVNKGAQKMYALMKQLEGQIV